MISIYTIINRIRSSEQGNFKAPYRPILAVSNIDRSIRLLILDGPGLLM